MHWITLGFYEDSGRHYCVQAKKGRNGKMRFSCRTVSGRFHVSYFKAPAIDVNEQWRQLIAMDAVSVREFVDAFNGDNPKR